MGYLTSILFYNDTLNDILEDSTFSTNIIRVCNSGRDQEIFIRRFRKAKIDTFLALFGLYRKRKDSCGATSCGRALRAQPIDTPRTIVVYGNSCIDLSQEISDKSDEKIIGRTDGQHMDYVKRCLDIASQDVRRLKNILKDLKIKK